jgi:hypothetical protein
MAVEPRTVTFTDMAPIGKGQRALIVAPPRTEQDRVPAECARVADYAAFEMAVAADYDAQSAVAPGLSDFVCAAVPGSTKAMANHQASSTPMWPVRSQQFEQASDGDH